MTFRRRHWRCWRFHWETALPRKPGREPHRQRHHRRPVPSGAIAMVTGQFGSNLVRDVTLAEALTQSDDRAAEILQREYAEPMRRVAERTCDRLADEAWSNVFGECFGPKGRLATYGGQRPLSAYLKTIVTREIYALAKREARRRTVEETAEAVLTRTDPDHRSSNEDPAEILSLRGMRTPFHKHPAGSLRSPLFRRTPVDRVPIRPGLDLRRNRTNPGGQQRDGSAAIGESDHASARSGRPDHRRAEADDGRRRVRGTDV
jgi:hypothetical protein